MALHPVIGTVGKLLLPGGGGGWEGEREELDIDILREDMWGSSVWGRNNLEMELRTGFLDLDLVIVSAVTLL